MTSFIGYVNIAKRKLSIYFFRSCVLSENCGHTSLVSSFIYIVPWYIETTLKMCVRKKNLNITSIDFCRFPVTWYDILTSAISFTQPFIHQSLSLGDNFFSKIMLPMLRLLQIMYLIITFSPHEFLVMNKLWFCNVNQEARCQQYSC